MAALAQASDLHWLADGRQGGTRDDITTRRGTQQRVSMAEEACPPGSQTATGPHHRFPPFLPPYAPPCPHLHPTEPFRLFAMDAPVLALPLPALGWITHPPGILEPSFLTLTACTINPNLFRPRSQSAPQPFPRRICWPPKTLSTPQIISV